MLANRMFFWDNADWIPAPTPTPTPVEETQESRGGGHKKRNDRYERLPESYWLVRERYLRRFIEPAVELHAPEVQSVEELEAPEPPGEVPFDSTILMRQALATAAKSAAVAPNPAALQGLGLRISQLSLDISRIQQQNYDQAIAILLLDAF